jgi:hypothetical protein
MMKEFNVKSLDIPARAGANGKEIEYSEMGRNPWGKLKLKYRIGKVYGKGGTGSGNSGKARNKDARNKGHVAKPRVMKVNGKTGKKVMVDD